jgi:signal transduction histidine kinase
MNTKLSIFRKGVILVAIPLVAQILFVGVLLFVQADQDEAQRLALHSKQVLAQTETAHRVIVEAQTSLRGFILVGLERFARDYETQRDRVPLEFTRLNELVSDNPPQQRQVERMSELASRFITWMNVTMQKMKKSQRQEVETRITSDEAKRLLSDLRQQMDEFLAEEAKLDSHREKRLKHSESLSFYMLFSGVGLAVVSSGMLLTIFSRSISQRLEVLFNNTRRLAAGEELAPRLTGGDELAQLDRVFHEMAEALHQKDQENEMFVYSVSHDLRSPLVNLQGFSRELDTTLKELRSQLGRHELPVVLKERLGKMLDRDAAEAIQFIQTAVMRLSAIIDALLRLSRAGRVEYRWQAVEVRGIVQRVVQSLHDSLSRKGAAVTIGDLPHCWGDLRAIDQIFANLIGNAVNYLDPARPGQIEVGWLPESPIPGLAVYFVKDNGLGIPESLQGKVFVAFQRLHPAAAPGEGIGLALVRRVVERLGGKIWLESKPGEGSTFYVALPSLPLSSAAEPAKLEPAANTIPLTTQQE